MSPTRALSLLLIVSILPLAPLAYASPIDPSFPAGLYDNGDFDDVIDLITSSIAAKPEAVLVSRPPPGVVTALHEAAVSYGPSPPLRPPPKRAPPPSPSAAPPPP